MSGIIFMGLIIGLWVWVVRDDEDDEMPDDPTTWISVEALEKLRQERRGT